MPTIQDAVTAEFSLIAVDLAKLVGAKKAFIHIEDWYDSGGEIYRVVGAFEDYNRPIASFKLKQLQGCSGILVSFNAKVEETYRGKGIGKMLHGVRLRAAKAAGYGMVQCTTRADNTHQLRILCAHGWKEVQRFVNGKTGNEIIVWLRKL